MRHVERLLDGARAAFMALATLCLGVMLAINAANILWRGGFGQSLNWVFPWTLLLFVWMVFLGLYVYLRGHRDVVVDVLVARLPRLPRLALALAADAIGLFVMVVILKGAWPLIRLQLGDMETIPLPQYLRSLPLFVSAALVVLHFASHMAGLVARRLEPFPREAPAEAVEVGSPE